MISIIGIFKLDHKAGVFGRFGNSTFYAIVGPGDFVSEISVDKKPNDNRFITKAVLDAFHEYLSDDVPLYDNNVIPLR